MVARIKIGSSLSRAFYYNENKVKESVANCIGAENFPIRLEKMTKVKRLDILQKTASLRPGLKANSVHISLNFAPTEQFSDERLKEIAKVYMDKIGFGQQPFLIYRHHDAGHPHIHIVTTKVRLDGSVINTNNIGKGPSEKARKEIEINYGLVRAEDQPKQHYELKSTYAQRVNYGKTESRKAISLVLNEVLKQYRFCSLPELNAALSRYNVMADRGTEDSRTFKNNGLHYKILDPDGIPVGIPIKASSFADKPTLKYLEGRFKANESLREPHKQRLKNTIDRYFMGSHSSLSGMVQSLAKDGIDTVLRHSSSGQLYGITYVDHKTKCVFNGSALGKNYSAKAIQERCSLPLAPAQEHSPQVEQSHQQHQPAGTSPATDHTDSTNLLEALMQPEYTSNHIPYELSGRKKKKRKGRSL